MAFPIPSMLLKQLYTFDSLKNFDGGVLFSLKNRLSDGTVTGVHYVRFDGEEVPLSAITMDLGNGVLVKPDEVRQNPIDFPLRKTIDVRCAIPHLAPGMHRVECKFDTKPFGTLTLKVDGAIHHIEPEPKKVIPRSRDDDYAAGIISERQGFLEKSTGVALNHLKNFSFDTSILKGNIEHFIGVAQVPIGLAGPVEVHGEHAHGEFLIPMATTEGTLVASYNRGMKVLNLSGGVRVTVSGDAMQRAPVFVFDTAVQARDFSAWVQQNFARIAEEAEATSSVARLISIDPYLAAKFTYLRFNYYTGDAAGQNMVGRATFAACGWIVDNYPGIQHFYLESNLATDKKSSQVNLMHTRGKRVIAEAVVRRDVLAEHLRVEPEGLFYHYNVSQVGSVLSGANNNGLHSANGITAMFIATGQDVANVAEGSAGIIYTEITPERDLYISITIPSLIVATYGGGTGLATQRECLELLGCYGKGKVMKLAEIVGAVVLAGEISLGAAISSSDWVSSHERYGRNR